MKIQAMITVTYNFAMETESNEYNDILQEIENE